jgi:hypothetical protein
MQLEMGFSAVETIAILVFTLNRQSYQLLRYTASYVTEEGMI